MSLAGLFVIVGFAWMLSTHRSAVKPRIIAWGLGIQFLFAVLIFGLPFGERLFLFMNKFVANLLGYAEEGASFLFGPLAVPAGTEGSLGYMLAFQALPAVIFFSAIMGLLYHWKVMPWVIGTFARLFTRSMRVSGAEGVCATSNIFVGIESAMAIRPFLRNMTRSELCLLLTAGMATIASTVLGLYVLTLQSVFPDIAGHLVTASLLSAPAALVMAKVVYPETEQPETLGVDVKPQIESKDNWMQAVTDSSMEGFKLAIGIGVALIAFISLLALVNGATGWIGGWFGLDSLRLEQIAGWIFVPFVFLMGVAPADVTAISELIGLRLLVTEVPAYQQLALMIQEGTLQSPRSAVIATYALCGFAHVASLGIFMGGIAALEPSRTKDLGAVGLRALLAATLACLITGCVAGIFTFGDAVSLLEVAE
ncbi:MAG: hypothetical protein JJU20_08445 [Opitutales bacterium]|nr:hypothetical protein [Opitutales bacterium]